jgi:hypothetical protein
MGKGHAEDGAPNATCRSEAVAKAPLQPSLCLVPDREFAADSFVHRRLTDKEVVLPESDALVADLVRQVRQYGTGINIDRFSPPIYIVPAGAKTVPVKAARDYDPSWSFPPLEAQWRDVPVPPNFRPSAGSDKEAIIYQPSTGRYWEFWGLEPVKGSEGSFQAAWGGMVPDLTKNRGYFPTPPDGVTYGVAASGLVLLGGLITIAEQRRGKIEHVLHLALPESRQGAHRFPAQRTDGRSKNTKAIPQGTLFRLSADLDVEALPMGAYGRMLARAAQSHGIIIRDTAGAVVFYAENPLMKGGPDHPYVGQGGILDCPDGRSQPSCYPDGLNKLAGFPWDKLQAIEPAAQ